MTTATKLPNSTLMSEIVSAARAVKHLQAAGYGTLGDLRKKGMQRVFTLKFVGQVSIEELQRAIGPQAPAATKPTESAGDDEPEFEESHDPLHLERTPTGPARISWTPSDKVASPGGGYRLQTPLWIEFDQRGRFALSERFFLMKKFARDEAKVNESIEAGRPWRQACADMLRREFLAHGHGFIVLSD